MNETTTVRANKGDGKLSKAATCYRCRKPLAKVRKYHVRTVPITGSGIAFYYSHVRCRGI